MLAQQLVHSQNFSFEERRYQRKQNQIKLLEDQANFCRQRCLMPYPQAKAVWGLKLKTENATSQTADGETPAVATPQGSEIPMELLPQELQCLQTCVEKVFVSERLLKAYIPKKFSRLSHKDIEKRLDNPTDSYGTYFEHQV